MLNVLERLITTSTMTCDNNLRSQPSSNPELKFIYILNKVEVGSFLELHHCMHLNTVTCPSALSSQGSRIGYFACRLVLSHYNQCEPKGCQNVIRIMLVFYLQLPHTIEFVSLWSFPVILTEVAILLSL